MISLFLLHDTGSQVQKFLLQTGLHRISSLLPLVSIVSKFVRFAIFFTHITMVFTMYRIYNRQRKQEKTERALPLSHKHFIPPLYTYVYRKDQVSPVPGLFVLLKYHLEQKHHKRHRHNRKQCSHNIDSAGILGVVSIYLAHLGDR